MLFLLTGTRAAGRQSLAWVLGLLTVCLLTTPGCGKKEEAAPELVQPVKVLKIVGQDGGQEVEYPGTIAASQQSQMAFEVSGKILAMPVSEGQHVSKGFVLARLDPSDYRAARDASLARKNAADAEFARVEELFARDAVSKAEFDVAQRNFEVAAAELKQTEKALADTRLRAVFAGRVARKLVDDFQTVRAGEPVIVLQDDSQLQVVIDVPEQDMARLPLDLGLEELSKVFKPRVEISSLPGRRFLTTVKEYASTADPATRTFPVTLVFEPPEDANIMTGMTVRVIAQTRSALGGSGLASVPTAAVIADAEGAAFVWLIDPQTMQVHRAQVEVGALAGTEIQVLNGLSPGDEIAVSGVHNLREGVTVRRLADRD